VRTIQRLSSVCLPCLILAGRPRRRPHLAQEITFSLLSTEAANEVIRRGNRS